MVCRQHQPLRDIQLCVRPYHHSKPQHFFLTSPPQAGYCPENCHNQWGLIHDLRRGRIRTRVAGGASGGNNSARYWEKQSGNMERSSWYQKIYQKKKGAIIARKYAVPFAILTQVCVCMFMSFLVSMVNHNHRVANKKNGFATTTERIHL